MTLPTFRVAWLATKVRTLASWILYWSHSSSGQVEAKTKIVCVQAFLTPEPVWSRFGSFPCGLQIVGDLSREADQDSRSACIPLMMMMTMAFAFYVT